MSTCQSPALSEPAGLISLEQLRTAVDQDQVSTVLVAVPGMRGRLKGKRFNARVFMDRMLSGTEACAYLLATDCDMTPLDGFALTGWNRGYGDLHVIPDEETFRTLAYEPGTVLVHGDLAHAADKTLIDVSPRQMVRTQLDRLSLLGLDVKIGLESEFVLYEADPDKTCDSCRHLRPLWQRNLDYSLDHPPKLTDYLRHLEQALHDAGTPVESVKTESAHGPVSFAASSKLFEQFLHANTALGATDAAFAAEQTRAGQLPEDDTSPRATALRHRTQPHRGWLIAREKSAHQRDAWTAFFEHHDVLISPAAPTPAIPNGDRTLHVNGHERNFFDQTGWANLISHLGLPAAIAPVGKNDQGLPLAVQIIGAPYADRTVLAMADHLGTIAWANARVEG